MSTSSPASADLPVPSKEQVRAIAKAQDEKHDALNAQKSQGQKGQEEFAAKLIQRNYRGYRERRQLQGLRLDASTRWIEAVKEARYRNATRPRSRHDSSPPQPGSIAPTGRARGTSEPVRETWRRVATIALRAGSDDHQSDTSSIDTGSLTPEEKEERRKRKIEAKRLRDKTAQRLQLQYYLELVDSKHRYGSNLRAYHEEWKKADTHENFFYWLDHGEGKNLEVPTCSRERLEREQVRYLSREERLNYLVKIDKEGRLCWAKNGERISTSMDYRDSINGIVPTSDQDTPEFRSPGGSASRNTTSSSSSSSSSDSSIFSRTGSPEGNHYVNSDLKQAKGVKKIKHISAAAVLDHLLRKSVKPNSWIFVADTSFRLYVGIKQSGAFQHSSFLHGSRISAAGLLKVKDGLLTQLSPLSGHYRPPTSNFRAFVHALRDAGVDMSHVSISRSYAVLVGLEAWVKTRRRVKGVGEVLKRSEEAVLRPEDAKGRKEREMDHTQAAKREAEVLRAEDEERKKKGWRGRLGRRLSRRVEPPKDLCPADGDSRGHAPAEKKGDCKQQSQEDEKVGEKLDYAASKDKDGNTASAATTLEPSQEGSASVKDAVDSSVGSEAKT